MINVGYVSLKVQLSSVKDLVEPLKNINFEGNLIKSHDLHMTLMYDSSNPVPLSRMKPLMKPDVIYTGKVTGFSMLGDEESPYRAVVMNIDSPEIVERHRELSVFMKHSFDQFIPHVSVLYGATERDLMLISASVGDIINSSNAPIIRLYGESFAEIKNETE